MSDRDSRGCISGARARAPGCCVAMSRILRRNAASAILRELYSAVSRKWHCYRTGGISIFTGVLPGAVREDVHWHWLACATAWSCGLACAIRLLCSFMVARSRISCGSSCIWRRRVGVWCVTRFSRHLSCNCDATRYTNDSPCLFWCSCNCNHTEPKSSGHARETKAGSAAEVPF